MAEYYFIYLIHKLKRKRYCYDEIIIHKLMFFVKAYALANGYPHFESLEFEAWCNGPVNPGVRNNIIRNFYGSLDNFYDFYYQTSVNKLSKKEMESINWVIDNMGTFDSIDLGILSHYDPIEVKDNESGATLDTPWKQVNPHNNILTNVKITNASIRKYYTKEWFEIFHENKDNIKEDL